MASGSQDLGTGYNNATTESLGLISGATGGSPQGIYEESSTQEYPIGTKREFEDGRVFRYALAGAAVAAGDLVSQDVSATAVVELQNKATAAAVGATEVILTDSSALGAATANQYAGGYLHTVDDAGEGFTYRIKSNTAASSNAVTFTLYDGLVVAVTTATDTIVTGNVYNKVVPAIATTDVIVAGVAARAFTSGYYGWVQTKGVATVRVDAAIAIGILLMLSDANAGQAETYDLSHPPIGTALIAQDTADGSVSVMLNIS